MRHSHSRATAKEESLTNYEFSSFSSLFLLLNASRILLLAQVAGRRVTFTSGDGEIIELLGAAAFGKVAYVKTCNSLIFWVALNYTLNSAPCLLYQPRLIEINSFLHLLHVETFSWR